MTGHDVEGFLRDLNAAWVERRYDDLVPFFDDRVVMLLPGTGASIVGADAMVDSYRQFGALGTVHAFRVEDVELHPRGPTVVAHLSFRIEYEMAGERHEERGVEVYVVDVTGARPRVLWRHQVPLAGEDA